MTIHDMKVSYLPYLLIFVYPVAEMIKTKERPENLIEEELDMKMFLTKDLLAEKPHTEYKLQSAVFV